MTPSQLRNPDASELVAKEKQPGLKKETLSETIKRRVASDPITIRDKREMGEKFRVLLK